ncbi:hypothetical protein TNCV_3592641 [Trichonephila clavipes]|nr:hypothetical protein TNCV_3592641 [Trichonephila clavipes]
MSAKIKLSLQEVLELLESLPSERSDSPTSDSSDEEVPANNLLEFSSDTEEHDEDIEQDPGCRCFYSQNTVFPIPECNKSKVEKKKCPNLSSNFFPIKSGSLKRRPASSFSDKKTVFCDRCSSADDPLLIEIFVEILFDVTVSKDI